MNYQKKPLWLRQHFKVELKYSKVKQIINDNGLHTICSSGKCPNQHECWSKGTATLMILGDICTRSCKFCNTKTGIPLPPDSTEPYKTAQSIQQMQLKHAVITSVDRDDLEDGGACHWAETIKCIKELNPNTTIEVLIPDFDGKLHLIDQIIAQKPDIISHNLETVERLTPTIRTKAKYHRSLEILRHIASSNIIAKTGVMLGLGETESELYKLMDDVIETGCSILTIGQYLQPSRKNIAVAAYIHPDQFDIYKNTALDKGFVFVESGPFIRSSYRSECHIKVLK